MFDGQPQDIEIYETAEGARPYETWFLSFIADAQTYWADYQVRGEHE